MPAFSLKNRNHGFTLFETLIYLVLFVILVGGGFLAAYQIIESSGKIAEKNATEAEADFIFRKIDWALNGDVDDVSEPSPDVLRVVKGGASMDFALNGDVLELEDEPLTSSQLDISSFDVSIIPASGDVPEAVEVTFDINGTSFGPTKRHVR